MAQTVPESGVRIERTHWTRPVSERSRAIRVSWAGMSRVLKRELNKQERASDAGMKSAAMGIIPFTLTDDLRAQLQAFGSDEADVNWIEMVRGLVMPRSACASR